MQLVACVHDPAHLLSDDLGQATDVFASRFTQPILIRKAQLWVCVCVCVCVSVSGTLGGMPGHARRACPKGTPEGRVLKGPRRGHCGRRPPGGAGGEGEKGGDHPPPKKISPKFFFRQKFPRRGHCGHRPPGGAGGRVREGGVIPPQKNSQRILFSQKNSPRGPLQPQAARGC